MCDIIGALQGAVPCDYSDRGHNVTSLKRVKGLINTRRLPVIQCSRKYSLISVDIREKVCFFKGLKIFNMGSCEGSLIPCAIIVHAILFIHDIASLFRSHFLTLPTS